MFSLNELFEKYHWSSFLEEGGFVNVVDREDFEKALLEFAKWMEERMYSEEDMRKAFIAGGNSQIEEDDDYGTEYDAYMEEWFEQFKKK